MGGNSGLEIVKHTDGIYFDTSQSRPKLRRQMRSLVHSLPFPN